MALRYTLPFGKPDNVKNLVFTILVQERELKLIDLTNRIKKKYGKSVTFQGVRKATLELVQDGVVLQKEKSFSINKNWVRDAKGTLDKLYSTIFQEKAKEKAVESIRGEVSVFTFSSLNEMMRFWQDLIDDWYQHFSKGDYPLNCWQGAHSWECLLHPDKEKVIMGQLKKKGIINHALCTSNTPLDRNIMAFYRKIGLDFVIKPMPINRATYFGTYGELFTQTQYPQKLVKQIDDFFENNTTLDKLDLLSLSNIVNMKADVKLTVIKNSEMAKQINSSILTAMK
jgi:hypothetical protein